jgi:membrane-associated phospholipid phosphatase
MFDLLLELDRLLFEWINNKLHSPLLDFLMPLITNALTWIPLYVGLIGFFIYKYRKRSYIPILGVILCFALADSISAKLLKPHFSRVRPCNETTVSARVVGVECRDSNGFPSSHASNHFAIAIFMIFLNGIRKRFGLGFWLGWAIVISYSRVYVGVHYPGDVLAGALLGCLIGFGISQLSNYFLKK